MQILRLDLLGQNRVAMVRTHRAQLVLQTLSLGERAVAATAVAPAGAASAAPAVRRCCITLRTTILAIAELTPRTTVTVPLRTTVAVAFAEVPLGTAIIALRATIVAVAVLRATVIAITELPPRAAVAIPLRPAIVAAAEALSRSSVIALRATIVTVTEVATRRSLIAVARATPTRLAIVAAPVLGSAVAIALRPAVAIALQAPIPITILEPPPGPAIIAVAEAPARRAVFALRATIPIALRPTVISIPVLRPTAIPIPLRAAVIAVAVVGTTAVAAVRRPRPTGVPLAASTLFPGTTIRGIVPIGSFIHEVPPKISAVEMSITSERAAQCEPALAPTVRPFL